VPGTLFLIEPELPAAGDSGGQVSAGHSLDPVGVLRMVRMFGGTPAKILLLGCEPASFLVDQGDIALSEPVKAAVPQAVEIIRSLLVQTLSGNPNIELTSKNRSSEERGALL
jgi:hydrogenase maturation protease